LRSPDKHEVIRILRIDVKRQDQPRLHPIRGKDRHRQPALYLAVGGPGEDEEGDQADADASSRVTRPAWMQKSRGAKAVEARAAVRAGGRRRDQPRRQPNRRTRSALRLARQPKFRGDR
jgi:hypothetical protein